MTCSMDVGASLVDFGVDCKCCSIDRFISNNDVAVFVNKDQVRDADLREV